MSAETARPTTNGFWNDRYQAGKGLIADEQGDDDIEAALNYWGSMDYGNGCHLAQFILLIYGDRLRGIS